MKKHLIFVPVMALMLVSQASAQKMEMHAGQAYWKVVIKRAEKIVKTLKIQDEAKYDRVRNLVAQQYYDLNGIHDELKSDIEQAKRKTGENAEKKAEILKYRAGRKVEKLHAKYLKNLSRELDSQQIEGVKNGMTYGVVPITYAGYLDMLPELKEEEKQQIMDWLLEAREKAMDAGSSEEKHGWFGKYKGRINNYLAARGYDLKKASEAREARIRAAHKW
ncbi:MAG: DUF3826 domain-containing protein [Mangrovibacterium sp.]